MPKLDFLNAFQALVQQQQQATFASIGVLVVLAALAVLLRKKGKR